MSTPFEWLVDVSVEDIVSIAGVEYLVPHLWLKLQLGFPSLGAVLKASRSKLVAVGLTDIQAKLILGRQRSVDKEMSLLKAKNINFLKLGDPNYPKLLAEINDPPLWLFYRGDLASLHAKTITVVGTRKPSVYALDAMAYVFSEVLSHNVTFLSGLAYGVDKRAHQLALKHGGKTVAVLAGGLDSIYPSDHYQLAEAIIESGGAIISEYPPLSRPEAYRFPIRNRILAGLSPLTVVVEAAIKSGTLTTAKAALDYNRDLMAIPGEINRHGSEGNNFLLKHGAALLDSPADLLTYYNIKGRESDQLVDKQLQATLDLVAVSPQSIDQLISASGKGVETVLSELTQLELLGLVRQDPPGQYVKTKNGKR